MADNALARGDWSTTSLRKQYGDEPLNALAAGVPMGDVASAWPGQYGDAVPQPNALMRFMASPQGQQLNILASFLGPRISAPKAAPLRPQPERPSTFYHSTSRDYNPSALKYDGGVASGIFASPDKEFSSGFGARTTEYKLAPGKYFDFRDPEHLKLLDPAKLWPDAVPEARRVWMNNVRRGEWSQMERGPVRQAIEDAGYDGMWLSHTMPDKRASRMNDTILAWRDGSFVEPTTVRVPEGPGSASPQGIRAYHGSPHDFDRFDLSKIGSGEGAQAYGHGLYFAENEGVARSYRDNLGGYDWGAQVPRRMADGMDVSFDVTQALQRANGDPARARELLLQDQKHFAGTGRDVMDAEALKLFDEIAPTLKPQPKGRMYEVSINARPEDFLDWDKPLSAQSEKVRHALGAYGEATVKRRWGGYDVSRPGADPVEVFSNGGGSWTVKGKGAADGASAMQSVQFANKDEALAFARQLTGANYVRSGAMTPEGSAALNEKGLAGIRYKDAMSRGAEGGTSNYVVFDDNLVSILRKYGLLPPAAAGAAAMTSQPNQEQ